MKFDPSWEPPPDDPTEVWGRRIGRSLALIAALLLALYLFATYLP